MSVVSPFFDLAKAAVAEYRDRFGAGRRRRVQAYWTNKEAEELKRSKREAALAAEGRNPAQKR